MGRGAHPGIAHGPGLWKPVINLHIQLSGNVDGNVIAQNKVESRHRHTRINIVDAHCEQYGTVQNIDRGPHPQPDMSLP